MVLLFGVECSSRGPRMASVALPRSDRTSRIAVLVTRARRKAMLSPFFAKCDGLLLINPDNARCSGFRANVARTSKSTCNLVLATGIDKLICGFIGEPDRNRLSALGVDVRLGSCSRPVTVLAREFEILPKA